MLQVNIEDATMLSMGCRGVYFALTEGEAKHLLEATNDESIIQFIQEDIERRWDEEWLQEADKSWDAIHRCLTDGSLRCRSGSPLEKFVLGGRQLHRDKNYIVSFLNSDDVSQVVNAARDIRKDWFRDRYFSLKKKFLWFTFCSYDGPIDETDFEYSWSYFEKIRAFFQKASDAGRSVLFTVDQ